jgi:hypothetical protein
MRLDRTHSAAFAALLTLSLTTVSASAEPPAAGPWPPWLPRYEVNMDLDLANHRARVQLRATWTNPQTVPTRELVEIGHTTPGRLRDQAV